MVTLVTVICLAKPRLLFATRSLDGLYTEGGFAFISTDIHLLVGSEIGFLLAFVKCVKGFLPPFLNEMNLGKHPVDMGAIDFGQILVFVFNGLFAQFHSPFFHVHFQ